MEAAIIYLKRTIFVICMTLPLSAKADTDSMCQMIRVGLKMYTERGPQYRFRGIEGKAYAPDTSVLSKKLLRQLQRLDAYGRRKLVEEAYLETLSEKQADQFIQQEEILRKMTLRRSFKPSENDALMVYLLTGVRDDKLRPFDIVSVLRAFHNTSDACEHAYDAKIQKPILQIEAWNLEILERENPDMPISDTKVLQPKKNQILILRWLTAVQEFNHLKLRKQNLGQLSREEEIRLLVLHILYEEYTYKIFDQLNYRKEYEHFPSTTMEIQNMITSGQMLDALSDESHALTIFSPETGQAIQAFISTNSSTMTEADRQLLLLMEHELAEKYAQKFETATFEVLKEIQNASKVSGKLPFKFYQWYIGFWHWKYKDRTTFSRKQSERHDKILNYFRNISPYLETKTRASFEDFLDLAKRFGPHEYNSGNEPISHETLMTYAKYVSKTVIESSMACEHLLKQGKVQSLPPAQ